MCPNELFSYHKNVCPVLIVKSEFLWYNVNKVPPDLQVIHGAASEGRSRSRIIMSLQFPIYNFTNDPSRWRKPDGRTGGTTARRRSLFPFKSDRLPLHCRDGAARRAVRPSVRRSFVWSHMIPIESGLTCCQLRPSIPRPIPGRAQGGGIPIG